MHVGNLLPAGKVGVIPGIYDTNADSVRITIYGKGGHGATPEKTIDPVLIAARTVVTLQSIVAREIHPGDAAVITVGYIQAGTKNNIIAPSATLGISVRSFDETVRARVLEGVDRILRAELLASGSPHEPTTEWGERYPVTVNDLEATARVNAAFAWFQSLILPGTR